MTGWRRPPREQDRWYTTGFTVPPVTGEMERARPRPAARAVHAAAAVLRPARKAARSVAVEFAVMLAVSLCLAAVAVHTTVTQLTPPTSGSGVCGTAELESPFYYDGATGSYTSGTAGLPTFGSPDTDFPDATAGDVLPPGTQSYHSFDLDSDTVYYFEPGGTYTGFFQADTEDAFVGGYTALAGGATITGAYNPDWNYGIDSNESDGDQPGVTIEYLTVSQFEPQVSSAAINPDSNSGWTLQYDTVTQNVPGAGMIAGTGNTIEDDCLTANGQYGFSGYDTNDWDTDSLTGGAYGITAEDNEISYNDACDIMGTLTSPAAGYYNYNPVPAALRNSHCLDQGTLTPDGDYGGFKLWRTDAVLIEDNWIHDNYGVAGWADTNNANTTWAGNYIADNSEEAIMEEISYNFSITGNTMVGNDWFGGLGNPNFPQVAVYISESGSDGIFGGIPACSEPGCSGFPAYSSQSPISTNTLKDNGGGIFLWENTNRYCGSGIDHYCTLTDPSVYSLTSCAANFATANVNTTTYAGETTGSPAEDYWDGCQWETSNVDITANTIINIPSQIPGCNNTAWSACGANGIFSEYGSPSAAPSYAVPTAITFWRGDTWSGNNYIGPPELYAWNQGNSDNPVSSADWTGATSGGDKCSGSSERSSGACTGPFGQDAGSSFQSAPTGGPGHAGVRRR